MPWPPAALLSPGDRRAAVPDRERIPWHLIAKRREKLTESERADLARMLGDLPEPVTLRWFADRISWLFSLVVSRENGVAFSEHCQ
jgi:hypothetical protein